MATIGGKMFRNLTILFISLLFIPLVMATEEKKPILTVYSYSSFQSKWGPGDKIKHDFEQQCDCIVNIVGVGDAVTLVNRLRLEGAKTKADVILGLDTNLISTAKKAQLVQPHQIAKPANLTIDWWDNDFIVYDYGYFAFIYNQNKIKNPPTSLDQLIHNQHNWKIVYQDPRTSTPGLGFLLWMNNVYGDKVNQAWRDLSKHTLTVTKGWSEAYGLFLKGEADFVLSYSTSPTVHIINDHDYQYKAAIFDEGHYRQIEVAALSRYTKQTTLARKFLAFLLTPEVQNQFVEKNYMYPSIKIELPNAYNEIETVKKSLSFTEDEVSNNQKAWITQWQNSVSQ